MLIVLFRDLWNENDQLKYTQKELLEKLEAQQKDFDTKQTVSGDQGGPACYLYLDINIQKCNDQTV